MRLFCLVHGSTQSPAGWKLLVSELESRGHRSVCVDLPTNEPDASANRRRRDCRRCVRDGCAHCRRSLGRRFVSAAGSRACEGCEAGLSGGGDSRDRQDLYGSVQERAGYVSSGLCGQRSIEITPLQSWPDVPASYISCSKDRTINRFGGKMLCATDILIRLSRRRMNFSQVRDLRHRVVRAGR